MSKKPKKECRNIKLSAFVDEIFQDSERNKDTKYVFFLGAGCSRSSGIPLASELASTWFSQLKKETHKYNEFIEKHKLKTLVKSAEKKSKSTKNTDKLSNKITTLYFQLFETLFPDPISRQKEIQRLTEDKLPGLGYYRLAQLMQKSAFNIVISTNFDDLMQDALIYSGVKRARTISHHHLAHFIDRGDTPHIIKLHGDAHLHPFNDANNTQQIERSLEKSVVSLLNNTKLIVIGYGGGDKSIAGLLEESIGIAQVYWLNGSPPENTELDNWWDKLDFKTFVDEYDFDKIMDEIGTKFDLDEPSFKTFANKLAYQYKNSLNKEIEEEAEEAIEGDDLGELNKLVHKLYRLGKYPKGIEVANEAVALAEEKYGKKHPYTATTYNDLAQLYRSMGEQDKALEYYNKALIICEEELGTDHPDTATIYNNLAGVYESRDEQEKALEYYKMALMIHEEALGTNHPDTATTYNNLAGLYRGMNEQVKALEFYKKALIIHEKVQGTDHTDTATTYNNLAGLYKSMDEKEKALYYYKKALVIYEEELHIDHPYTATTYNNLAGLFQSMGKQEKALEFYKKALAIKEEILGTNHPDTATTANNLAGLYQSMGEQDKALEYYKKALMIFEKKLPEGHKYIKNVQEGISRLNPKKDK